MATNTMVALQTITASGSTGTVSFTSIPSTYTDLVLVMNTKNGANSDVRIRFNSDTATNYSRTYLSGNGSSAYSGRGSSQTYMEIDAASFSGSADGQNAIIQLQNYSNANVYKTILVRANNAGYGTDALVGLWRSTSAISQIDIFNSNSSNWTSTSTFTLYGIASSDIPAYATGGFVSQDSTYWYHAFPMSGTFTPKQALTADILVVAGGGGGGNMYGGGGGAGGLLVQSARSLSSGTAYTCTVGAGGAANSNGSSVVGNNGSNTVFDTVTAIGGGGGGTFNNIAGVNGGSGGGGPMGASNGGTYGAGGSATQGNSGGATGYGYNGGQGYRVNPQYNGGGGGGAGGAGGTATTSNAGNGGAGYYSTLTDAMGLATGLGQISSGHYYFAGGGAGGSEAATAGVGGLGGGGNGGTYGGTAATNGLANTGGGGGAVGGNLNTGTSGGSGIIIVRYAK